MRQREHDAGSRHCADVAGTFCGDDYPQFLSDHTEAIIPGVRVSANRREPATVPFRYKQYGLFELPVFPLSQIARWV